MAERRHFEEKTKLSILEGFLSLNGDVGLAEFARNCGVSRSTLFSWLKNNKLLNKVNGSVPVANKSSKGEKEEEHPLIEFGTLPSNRVDVVGQLSELAEKISKRRQGNKDYAKVSIKTDRPIAVMKGADFHLGGLDIAYDSLLAHYKFLLEEEGFYLQLFGDDINMMIVHRSVGARHDVLTPNGQYKLLSSMVDELVDRNKLISMCWGNHSDEFTEKNVGLSFTKYLLENKIPYFRGMGYLDLGVGAQTYPMAFTHKTRFHSFMNALHGNKRMEQMHAEYFTPDRPIAREYITAHTHYPAVSHEGCLPKDRIWYVKTGTFKTDCLYSQRYFGQGRIGIPTMVYFPDRMEHVCFPTPYEAYRYMNGRDWPGLKNSEKK